MKKVGEKSFDCVESLGDLKDIKIDITEKANIRSENYWKLSTYLDCRLIDLDFLERYSARGAEISSSDLVELYFLRKIVEKARGKLYKK